MTMASKDQLMHIFLNLGINALEAMPDGGELRIKTYAEKGNLCIDFKDTGKGMSEHVASRIFDPFFSTKEKGLGLGLSIVHNMVIAHGGSIILKSKPDEGSTFTVILPIRSFTGEG